MNIKDIVSKTILFILIVGFIIGFQTVFGVENSLIGVTTITAMLMLLEKDLTTHPVSSTFKLICLNVFTGIAAFIANFNMWFAIPINFITMFTLSYSLLYNLKKPLYLPFSLQYLFILVTPVSLNQMPLRLSSLFWGAIAIMILQILFNKNKVTKSGNKLLNEICTLLCQKIEQIKRGEDIREIEGKISTSISILRNIIFDKRKEDFYLGEEARIKLNLSASLEKINLLINKVSKEKSQQAILDDLTHILTLAAASINNKNTMDKSNNFFGEILNKYEHQPTYGLLTLSILNIIYSLKDNLSDLKALDKDNYKLVKKTEKIPEKYRKMNIGRKVKHTNNIKLSYAIRMGVGISISGFISDFFHLNEGRWIIFTMLALVIPIYEHSHKKVRDRIFATILGSILVITLFTIFQGTTARITILMLAGYLNNYIKSYRYSTILITLSAIGAAALITDTTSVLTIHRIYLVAIGTILALLINKFVFPYKLGDANRDLEDMYRDVIQEMLKEVYAKIQGTGSIYGIKNLFMITTMIEDRIKLNNQELEDHPHAKVFEYNQLLTCTIYELYICIDKRKVTGINVPLILDYLEKVVDGVTNNVMILEIENLIMQSPDLEDKIVFSMLFEIVKELDNLRGFCCKV